MQVSVAVGLCRLGDLYRRRYRAWRCLASNLCVMGQQVGVVEKISSIPGVLRFEANRNLTGMGHERFTSVRDAVGPRPAAELARRLLSTGQVAGVHVYGNVITVDIEKGFSANGLADIVRNLYQYWKPGMTPPSIEDLTPPAEVAASAGPAGEPGAAVSAATSRVPAELLERSRAALAKWKATHGTS